MKAIFCSALLITLLAAPGYADTSENSAAEQEERGLSIVVDIGSDVPRHRQTCSNCRRRPTPNWGLSSMPQATRCPSKTKPQSSRRSGKP